MPDVDNDQYSQKLAVEEGFVPVDGGTRVAGSFLESQYVAAGPDRHEAFIARRNQLSQAFGTGGPPTWLSGWTAPAFDSVPQPMCGNRSKWSRHFDPAGFRQTIPDPAVQNRNGCPYRGDRVRTCCPDCRL